MNIPNCLTILRILLIPALVFFFVRELYLNALVVFALTSITDALDGFLARQFDMQTKFGAYLDPIADKALLSTCYIGLAMTGALPVWLAVVVISRDVLILLGFLVLILLSASVEARPALISKITTIFQMVTVFVILLTLALKSNNFVVPIHILIWLTAALTMVSGFLYLVRGLRMMSRYNMRTG